MNTPCKGCDKRTPECHGKCETYLTWQTERNQRLVEEYEYREAVRYRSKKVMALLRKQQRYGKK